MANSQTKAWRAASHMGRKCATSFHERNAQRNERRADALEKYKAAQANRNV